MPPHQKDKAHQANVHQSISEGGAGLRRSAGKLADGRKQSGEPLVEMSRSTLSMCTRKRQCTDIPLVWSTHPTIKHRRPTAYIVRRKSSSKFSTLNVRSLPQKLSKNDIVVFLRITFRRQLDCRCSTLNVYQSPPPLSFPLTKKNGNGKSDFENQESLMSIVHIITTIH